MYIFYGDICMDWKYVSRVLDVLGERQVLEAFLSSERLFASQTRTDIMTGVTNANTMSMFRGEVGPKRGYPLSEMLEASLGFNSTDPRDKVYALLGMSSENSRNEIVPNYSKENLPHQVYTEAMHFLLVRRVNPLHCLNLAGIGHDRLVQDLPSWVPDWSLCVRPQPLDHGYSAASTCSAVIIFDPQDCTLLSLYGETIDTVQYMGEIRERIPNWTAEEVNIYMQKWFSDAEALAQQKAIDPYPIVGSESQSVLEAFIRTMVSNRCSYDNEVPSTKQCFEDYKATKAYYASPYTTVALSDTNNPAEAALREAILEKMTLVERHSLKEMATKAGRFMHFAGSISTRRFCITEKGRMATVPPFTKEGDRVCLLKGAKMPYLMREKTDEDRNVYELVGNCYVHGVMNGEVPIQNQETFWIV